MPCREFDARHFYDCWRMQSRNAGGRHLREHERSGAKHELSEACFAIRILKILSAVKPPVGDLGDHTA